MDRVDDFSYILSGGLVGWRSFRNAQDAPKGVTAVDKILGWPPILWTLRASVLIVVGGVSFTMALYLARFLRPKHLWWLLTADLPKFKRVGGSVTVLGQELAASATMDTARAQESNALDRRVARL